MAHDDHQNHQIELPVELVSNGCPGPFERRAAGGVIMLLVRPSRGQRRVPVSLARTLSMCGALPAGGRRIFSC